jgi:hypothetical protein
MRHGVGGYAMPVRIWIASPLAAALLGSCAVLPGFGPEGAVKTAEIVHRVECELRSAYQVLWPDYPKLEDWAAGYKLTFKTDATHTGGVSGNWSIPGGVTLVPGAGVSSTGSRLGLVKYQRGFKDIADVDCLDAAGADAFPSDLGILEWLQSALAPSGNFQRTPKELTYQVSFVARYDASLKPTFFITNFTGTPSLSASKSNTNTLDIAFVDATQAPVKPPKPIPVYIVGGPVPVYTVERQAGQPTLSAAPAEVPVEGTTLSIEVQERLDELLDNQ